MEIARALRTNASLTSFSLSQNAIGDDGALALAAALHRNTTLVHLFLNGDPFGDVGIAALAEVRSRAWKVIWNQECLVSFIISPVFTL